MSFGAKIKELRGKEKSQHDLAASTGISRPLIAKIETDDRAPNPDDFLKICKALGANPDELVKFLPPSCDAARFYLPRKKRGPNFALPHYGEVPCGTPIDVTIPPEPESLDVFTPLVSDPGRFLVTAKGRSMTGRGIQEGDRIIAQKQPVANNGQLVVVVVDEKVTLKVFRIINRKVYLYAASNEDEHERIEFVEGRDRIQGVVVGLVRRFPG